MGRRPASLFFSRFVVESGFRLRQNPLQAKTEGVSMFQVYLPIAEMAVPGEVILALGGVVGFLSAVFGVGGGFLATPFLVFLGVPPSIAVGTQANQLAAASLTGVIGHWKRGNVDVRMGGLMLAGSILGSVVGIAIFRLLQHIGQIDAVINILYVLLLGNIGVMMLIESLNALLRKKVEGDRIRSPFWDRLIRRLPYPMRFPKSKLYISALVPAAIGFVGGVMVSILGIGGGFFLVPAMIYIIGMPTLLVAGTSLFQILFTTVFATVLHAVANKTVDLVLAALLIVGGVIGVQIGIRAARHIKGAPARLSLAAMLLLVCLKLVFDLLIEPSELFSTEIRG
jgi:uncharacterized membrane protein YfcA